MKNYVRLVVVVLVVISSSIANAQSNCWWCQMCGVYHCGPRGMPASWYDRIQNLSIVSQQSKSVTLPQAATPKEAVTPLLGSLNLTRRDLLYDIGCGEGTLLIAAVQQFGCKALGIEIDATTAARARANVRAAGLGKSIHIQIGDAKRLAFDDATAVALYATPELLRNIVPRIKTDRIASYSHPIPGRHTRSIKTTAGMVYVTDEPLVVDSPVDGWKLLNR